MDIFSSEPQWRTLPLRERLSHAFQHELFTDDIPAEYQGTSYTFKAHKNILGHCSPLLADHFYGPKKGEYLKGINPLGLSTLLNYLYNVSSNKDTTATIWAYEVAKTLRFQRVEDWLERCLIQQVRLETDISAAHFWKSFEFCRALKLHDVSAKLLDHARLHAQKILRDPSFASLSPGSAMQILKLDDLEAPEIDVLDSVARWYETNKQMPFSRHFLKDMLECVRFRNLSWKDFRGFLKDHSDVLDVRDAMQILGHLGSPGTHLLPQWCSSKVRLLPIMDRSAAIQESLYQQDDTDPDLLDLPNMLDQKQFTDICFLVGPDKVPVRAHRNILAIGSPVFEKMFYGSLATSKKEMDINTTSPPGFQTRSSYADGFEKMIGYFYGEGGFDRLLSNSVLAIATFEASLKYGCARLIRLCSLRCHVGDIKADQTPSVETFWRHLEYLLILGADDQREAISGRLLPFASEHIKQLLKHSTFFTASKEALAAVLELDHLCIKEVDLLRYTMRWIRHKERRENFKEDLLRHVRFSDLSLEEFVSLVTEDRGFFASEDCVAICAHLFDRKSPLPRWCGSGNSRDQVTKRKVRFAEGKVKDPKRR